MTERQPVPADLETRLLTSLHSTHPVIGLTHNFYRYPARMSPELAGEIIHHFTRPGDTVVDPFMGGGTTIVEAVAAGRCAIGVDLNPLATFVAEAKTTPLSGPDASAIERWAWDVAQAWQNATPDHPSPHDPRSMNLPEPLVAVFSQALERVSTLEFPRQRRFARCALLRLGQWAVDCKTSMPARRTLSMMLIAFVGEMLAGLDQVVAAARAYGVPKHQVTGQRMLLLRSAVGLEEEHRLRQLAPPPTLVLTSPPYPAVHVLYHRWQVQGRRETPAPYWFIGAQDGRGASHYTMGSRTALGLDHYFRRLVDAYRSVRSFVGQNALVAQLVFFADPPTQLPAFLSAMEEAGFREDSPLATDRASLWRNVPNRKWYCRVGATHGAAREVLLFHRPMGPA